MFQYSPGPTSVSIINVDGVFILFLVVTFQVQTENRYKLAKQYRKLKEKAGTSNEDGFSHVLQHAKVSLVFSGTQ